MRDEVKLGETNVAVPLVLSWIQKRCEFKYQRDSGIQKQDEMRQ